MDKSVLPVIKQIQATNSINEKFAILSANSLNEDLALYLAAVYSPNLNFWVTSIEPANKIDNYTIKPKLDKEFIASFKEIIADRKLTGNAARGFISSAYTSLNAEEQQLFEWLIKRDVRAGFDAVTINKVWNNLIPIMPYMRCELPKKSNPKDWFEKTPGLEVYSQIKMDAMFANVTCSQADGHSIRSRNGSLLSGEWTSDLFLDIDKSLAGTSVTNFMLHGELIVRSLTTGKYLNRQLSNGYMNSISQGSKLNEDYQVEFVAWDMIPLSECRSKNKYVVSYANRLQFLSFSFQRCDRIKIVETEVLDSYDKVVDHYKRMLKEGKEGTVVKHPNGIWMDGTSPWQVKMKQSKEFELVVVGYEEGKDKWEGSIGSLICESSDGKLKCNLPSMKDSVRKAINADRNGFLGKIVTGVGNCVLEPSPSNKLHSIFHPRFKEFRTDRTSADSLERIIAIFSEF